MFGIGTTELILILVIVLLLFGPSRLPELAKSVGRMIHELRRSATGLRDEIERGATNDSAPNVASKESAVTPDDKTTSKKQISS